MARSMEVSVLGLSQRSRCPCEFLRLLFLMPTWAAGKQILTLVSAAVGESSLQPRRTPLGQPAPPPGSANNLAAGSESPAGKPYATAQAAQHILL